MKSISLKLPRGLHARLEAVARKAGRSKSEVTRQAIEAFLEGQRGQAKGSCFDLAKDLAGCVEGPGDLSFNKRRLRGCGK